MINEIVKGISLGLNAAFGDEYRIYQNDVEQGFREPCFFIQTLKPERSPLLGGRALQRNHFDILYFPKDPGNNAAMLDVGENLMDCLEYITIPGGDKLRGIGMSYEIVDDVLHFFVSYNHTVHKTTTQTAMEGLTVTMGMKGEEND